ncbi:MAG: DUF6178 family protein [Thermodesulfobacteriota bacterium]|nr:DUF6178 family protein [Thermodesulfobacteriota bacterium]
MDTKEIITKEIFTIESLPPEQRARSIIASPYTGQIMANMPVQDIHLILKESWEDDASILLNYVSEKQFPSLVDLDCWRAETLSIPNFLNWMETLLTASEQSYVRAMESLDIEIVMILFQDHMEVTPAVQSDDNIPDLMDAGFESLDSMFFFRFLRDDEENRILRECLKTIFSSLPSLYFDLMSSMGWETRASLEETAYERRVSRLMELGFVPRETALGIYHLQSPERILSKRKDHRLMPVSISGEYRLPGIYKEGLDGPADLIDQAIEHSDDERITTFGFEMVYLVNKVIMADFMPVNDSTEIKRCVGKTRRMVCLGLEIATRQKGLDAKDILNEMNAEALFSLAYNMIVRQQKRLKSVLKYRQMDMIPLSDRNRVEGLMKKRPMYGDRPFEGMDDLKTITSMVGRITAMADIMACLDWEDQADNMEKTNAKNKDALDMENIILTSLASNVTGKGLVFSPLDPDQLRSFLDTTTQLDHAGTRKLMPSFGPDMATLLASVNTGLSRETCHDLSEALVKRLDLEISGLEDTSQIDPRFITCLIVKLRD